MYGDNNYVCSVSQYGIYSCNTLDHALATLTSSLCLCTHVCIYIHKYKVVVVKNSSLSLH